MTSEKLFEMASVGNNIKISPKSQNEYDIKVNGGKDRVLPPHFHVYLSNRNIKLFSVEFSISDLLSDDVLNIISIIDCCYVCTNKKKLELRTKDECISKGDKYYLEFRRLYYMLFEKPLMGEATNCKDLLDHIIKTFNKEADIYLNLGKRGIKYDFDKKEENKILVVMRAMNKKILPKFQKYFTKDQIKLYPEVFKK